MPGQRIELKITVLKVIISGSPLSFPPHPPSFLILLHSRNLRLEENAYALLQEKAGSLCPCCVSSCLHLQVETDQPTSSFRSFLVGSKSPGA